MSSTILGIIASSSIASAGTSYESIATATGTGSSGTITFNPIPTGFKHLQIRAIASSTSSYFLIQFNSDTVANYTSHFFYGDGSISSFAYVSATTAMYGGRADNDTTNLSVSIVDILDYRSTSKYKTVRIFTGQDANGTGIVMQDSGLWAKTEAINSITITTQSGNFGTNNTFALYGIKEF